ncbi:MAG: hypothetical protein K2M42_09645 [Oscillospiraceae bacterium]|nr:hypothetical protein [Oscillospiraceae bacterium]
MPYTDAERRQVDEFFQQEWDRFSKYFYATGKNVDPYALVYFAREYAKENGYPPGLTALLSEEYADDKIWEKVLTSMQSVIKKFQADKVPRKPPPPPTPAALPGIPRDGSPASVARARAELGLSNESANKAVRPLPKGIRLGNPLMVSKCPPLYHETVKNSSGEGVKNQTGNRHVITFFYVLEGDEYYLVAWGEHKDGKRGESIYRVERQLDTIPSLIGLTLGFSGASSSSDDKSKPTADPGEPTKQPKPKYGRPPPKGPPPPPPPKKPPKKKK